MDQRIEFCTAADGICIAYATLDGGGPPVIYVAGFPAHLEAEWDRPVSREFLSTLADGLTLTRYDMRGCGLSDREVDDVSLGSLVRDLEAVADAAGHARFALLGLGMLAGPIALTYAASHPERVTRLVLCSAFSRGRVLAAPARQKQLVAYTETFGFPVLEYAESPDPKVDRTGRDMVHLAASPALQAALLRTFFSVDVTDLLPRVTMPATILHGSGDRLVPFAEGRRLASLLPNASFVSIEGDTGAAMTKGDDTVPAIRRALEAAPAQAVRRSAAPGVVTVLFTDIVGHTEMMRRLGDARGREVLREHERITRETLREHGGEEIKTTGDGFMACFASVTQAVECAIALQRAFERHSAGADEPLHVRVGLNAGEPIREDGDLFGSTVILASRIASSAGAGDILASVAVRELCAGKGFLFADRGESAMRGFEEMVRLYEVRWRE